MKIALVIAVVYGMQYAKFDGLALTAACSSAYGANLTSCGSDFRYSESLCSSQCRSSVESYVKGLNVCNDKDKQILAGTSLKLESLSNYINRTIAVACASNNVCKERNCECTQFLITVSKKYPMLDNRGTMNAGIDQLQCKTSTGYRVLPWGLAVCLINA